MPRPRGADAAGLLLRELELHPPAEEWHRRNMFGGPWCDPEDMGPLDDTAKMCNSSCSLDMQLPESCEVYHGAQGLWPRKRRMSERDAAFGLNTSLGLGAYLGIMGSRRDVVTALWKTGLEGAWFKVCYNALELLVSRIIYLFSIQNIILKSIKLIYVWGLIKLCGVNTLTYRTHCLHLYFRSITLKLSIKRSDFAYRL